MKNRDKLDQANERLNVLYDSIPETKGCMEHISKPKEQGGCGGWCCLTPEVRVYTSRGMKPIADIKPGWRVYTTNGWQNVVEARRRFVKQDIVKIKSRYGRVMRLTPDHLVLTDVFGRKNREKPSDPTWVEAGDLIEKRTNKQGHYLIFPKIKLLDVYDSDSSSGERLLLDILASSINCYWDEVSGRVYASKAKRGKSLPSTIQRDELYCWFLGIYLAEGWSSETYVEINFNEDEHSIFSRLEEFADRFKLNYAYHRQHGKTVGFRIHSVVLSRLMRFLCGNSCDTKELEAQEFSQILQDYARVESLHAGLYAGDGTKKLAKKQQYAYITTSKNLRYQVEWINNVLEEFPVICQTSRDGKLDSYTLSISLGKYKDYVETHDDFRVPIKEVEREYYEGWVYDIEVENVHNFFTECGIVHNCKFQNPQVLSVEYENAWKHVIHEWPIEDIIDLIELSIRNYLSDVTAKGCVFWNPDTKMCRIHQHRPYNCRIYGITPDEEFKPRLARLREQHKYDMTAVLRDQCELIGTADDSEVTIQQSTKWWAELVSIEESTGVDRRDINDDPGGTYRTFHDHILLHTVGDKIMNELQSLRLYADAKSKEIGIRNLMVEIRAAVEATMKLLESEGDSDAKKG